ncbi:hypothetical protein NS376_12870 [Pseudomonas oryzihabitans]|nr:hypothetical protein NS376_12870 [Pseudomonas psychrotolerans]
MENAIDRLTAAFSTYKCSFTAPRPDGSIVLTVQDRQCDDARVNRVISARQLGESQLLKTVIDEVRKDVSLRAGALAPQSMAVLRATGANMLRYSE